MLPTYNSVVASRRCNMKNYQLTIVAISLLCLLLGLSTLTSKATTTFIRSTIVGIDQAQHTLTFRTLEGQSWTLPVADPNILTKEQLSRAIRSRSNST